MSWSSTVVALLMVGSCAWAQDASGFTNPTPPPEENTKKSIDTRSSIAPSSSRTESSLFYFLNMSGRKRADFRPLTAKEKAQFYGKALFGPIMLFTAGASAGIAQWKDTPPAWGQGGSGYGERFANYYAKQAIQRTLRLGLEDLLHEDNRYFQSGDHGFGKRIGYALKSSIMARGDDGHQHISVSGIGSIAGAAFISRLWQPSTNNKPSDGVTSFAISMAATAGTNCVKEFLPDLTRHVFHRHEPQQQAFAGPRP